MRRQLLAVALFLVAPVGCKSVELKVDYPGMHVAAKFEAHDRQRDKQPHDAASEKIAKRSSKSESQRDDPARPSITVTL